MELERFHNDLLASLETRVPLEIGETSVVRLTKSKLKRLRESVIASVGDSPDLESLAQLAGRKDLPKRYLAALRTFAQTDSMSPVLDGLTIRVTSIRKVSRLLRRVLIYLVILMAAALLGLWIFSANVTPVIEDIHAEIFLRREELASRFDFIVWLPAMIVGLAVMLVLMLVWIVLGGATRSAMWFGGRKYLRCWTSATALRILQLLTASGMEVEDAFEVSCDLAGVDGAGRREIQNVVLPEQGDNSASPAGVVQGELKSLANYMLVLSEHHLEKMRLSVPLLLVALVGGAISLMYCAAIFSPITNLLWDLNFAGTN